MVVDTLVSVVIPTYNRAHAVCEAIDSVLQQTYRSFEVIVVDDGSKDNTLEVLGQYGNHIRVFAYDNAGPSIARNRGIAAAKGDLVAFLDSDDLWLPQKLERQVNLMNMAGDSVPCCLSNIKMCWPERQMSSFEIAQLQPSLEEGIWTNVAEVLATRFLLFTQAVMIRRKVLERVGGFDETIRFMEDYQLPLRLSLEGSWAFNREPLVIWRENEGASWSKESEKQDLCRRECYLQVVEDHARNVKRHAPSPELKSLVRRRLKSARRELRNAQIACRAFPGARLLAAGLHTVERYRRAAFVRSPWFPQMQIEPCHDLRGTEPAHQPA